MWQIGSLLFHLCSAFKNKDSPAEVFIAIRVVQVTGACMTWTTAISWYVQVTIYVKAVEKLETNADSLMIGWRSSEFYNRKLSNSEAFRLHSSDLKVDSEENWNMIELKQRRLVNFSTLGIAFPKHYHYFFRARECFPNERNFQFKENNINNSVNSVKYGWTNVHHHVI